MPKNKKPKVELDNDETYIAEVRTDHTGGNIYNDVITLKDGTIIRISEGCIGVYANAEDDENGNEIGMTYY